MKIVHQNAQTATNKIDELTLLCNELLPDVFVVSEHGFSLDTIDQFYIKHYQLANYFCRRNFKGGGVSIFVKDNLNFQTFTLNEKIELDFEAEGVKVQLSSSENIIVVGLYRSPNGCIRSFFDKLEELLTKMFSKSSKFLIIGDININVLDPTNPNTQRLRDMLRSFNLKWSIESPTRITHTSRTAIDNVISNISNITVSVLNSAISDHFAQEAVVHNCKQNIDKPTVKLIRTLKAQNINLLNNFLKNEDWTFLNDYSCTEDMFNAFNNCFNYYLDLSCPFKKSKQVQKTKNSSWITKGILVSRDRLKFYNHIFINTQNEEFKIFFRRYKQTYKKVIKAAKAYDVNRALNKTENFSKTAWEIINNSKGSNFKTKSEIKKIQIDDREVDDPVEIANEFNSFFSSIASAFQSQTNPRVVANDREPVFSMALTPVDEEEVSRVIQKLNSKKTCDANGISVWLLKQCFKNVLTPLTQLINSSFETGIFPSILKIAKVVPIFKKDDPLQPSNYRPISILPVFSKVFEKIFCERVESYLDHFQLLCNEQFGFRKNKSTIDAINNLIINVVEGLERREHVLSIFLDLSKAFDCVHHEILLHQLEACGIRGLPHKWLSSYLGGRSQYVEISNVLSTKRQISQGVPQGSILGPLLFLIYVNKLPSVKQHGELVLYADDTTLCFKEKTLEQLEIVSFIELNSCIQYFSEINLATNHSKSNMINFSLRQQEHAVRPAVCVDDVFLEETESTKFLGMYLDRGLTWCDHVDSICAKLASGIFAMRTLDTFCSIEVLKMAYFGLVYPHFAYGLRLWGSCSNARFQRVFILQKKAVRIIKKLNSRESCKNSFRELGLLTLPCLYMYEIIVYCKSKCDLVQGRDIHQYETRGRDSYRVQQHRLTMTHHLPEQIGVRLINSLPDEIKQLNSLSIFKNRLKHLLVSNSYYSIQEFLNSQLELNV